MGKKRKQRKPEQGESFFVRSVGNFKCAHCHALYLGPDATGNNKILLGTFNEGWSIVDMEDVEDALRLCGKFNIESEIVDKDKNVLGYEYAYYDNRERFLIKVKRVADTWKIISEFELPSWAQGEVICQKDQKSEE